MGFEWDDAKNAENLAKHGVAFEEAALIFDGPRLEKVDQRFDYGEERIITLGQIEPELTLCVVYTWRGDTRRLISARKASRHEREAYEKALSQP
jgi:uncharacterized DUF497 family protein